MVPRPGMVRWLSVGAVLLVVLLLAGCVQGPCDPPALPPPVPSADSGSPPPSPSTPAPPAPLPSGANGNQVATPPPSQGTPADSVSPAFTVTVPRPADPVGAVPFVPGGVYHAGESILFEGTTILSPGNPLLVEVRAFSFVPTRKTDTDLPSGASAVIQVRKGSIEGQNTWQFLLTTTGMAPGDYSFEITGLEVPGFRSSAGFTLMP